MRKRFIKTLAASVAAIGLAQPAFAVLDSVGPVDPANGFPAWYMDRNGVALELCTNLNATVLTAGGCVTLPADLPNGVPEVFPTNWFIEHFYTLASVVLTTAGVGPAGTPVAAAGKVTFGMGLEGSFATPTPVNGQQIVFNRWRVTHTNTACEGSYTYYTPNNAPQTFVSTAGGKIFETSDIGVGTFSGPLAGTTGPFLLPSRTPGDAALAPFTGPDGRRYIADYNIVAGQAVTGSALPNPLLASPKTWIPAAIKALPFANYVLVEGPGVATGNCAATESVSSTNTFQLFGRYYNGVIPAPSKVDRATFTVVDTNADGTPDTYQIGVWSTAQQKPAGALPSMAMSLVTGDPANPSAVTPEAAMSRFQLGTSVTGVLPKFEYFGNTTAVRQITGSLAAQARPAADYARVRITTDVPVTTYNVPLVDELTINEAMWDSSLKTLTVVAESGAFLSGASPVSQTANNTDCSAPCLTIDNLGMPVNDASGQKIDYKMKSQAGSKYAIMSATIPNVQVPPDNITVVSSAGGRDTKPVMYAGVPTGTALLIADTASTPMNVAVTVPVLLNDIGVSAVPGMQICTAATGGTCAVPNAATACVLNTASPQCTASGGRIAIAASQVTYTPKAGVGGVAETFWYQVSTSSGLLRAPVTVSIGSISGLPDARDDLGINAVVGKAAPINVLANDFAPAGINMATLSVIQGPCFIPTGLCNAALATFDAQGRLVFSPDQAGAWTMQYTFTDNAGVVADRGVVNVNVVAGESLAFGKALFSLSKVAGIFGNIVATGTSTVALGQILELRLPNAATGVQGCNAPALGTRIAVTTVGALGAWAFSATALSATPVTVYVYSPAYGACTQVTVTAK
ncbi:MAG: hypothetical protein WCO67_02825 [Betaproteobacteria bacterium]